MELQPIPTYVVTSFPVNEIQLRSGKIINKEKAIVIIEEEDPQVEPKDKTH